MPIKRDDHPTTGRVRLVALDHHGNVRNRLALGVNSPKDLTIAHHRQIWSWISKWALPEDTLEGTGIPDSREAIILHHLNQQE